MLLIWQPLGNAALHTAQRGSRGAVLMLKAQSAIEATADQGGAALQRTQGGSTSCADAFRQPV